MKKGKDAVVKIIAISHRDGGMTTEHKNFCSNAHANANADASTSISATH